MGTNLEIHTEVKIDGTWHHYGCPHVERNYRLYAKMGNTRNEDKIEVPLDYTTGLPSGVTALTRFCWKSFGRPEIKTLDLEEIKKLVKWYEKTYGTPHGLEGEFDYVLHNGWASIPGSGIEDARFIFWET